jgi:hypothetical protein
LFWQHCMIVQHFRCRVLGVVKHKSRRFLKIFCVAIMPPPATVSSQNQLQYPWLNFRHLFSRGDPAASVVSRG